MVLLDDTDPQLLDKWIDGFSLETNTYFAGIDECMTKREKGGIFFLTKERIQQWRENFSQAISKYYYPLGSLSKLLL